LAVTLIPAAHATVRATSGTPQTTAPDVFVNVRVTITDARISLDRRSASRGDEVRFVIRNIGTKPHNFTLGSAKRGTGVQTGFSTTLKPKEQKITLLYLDYRGPITYRSTIKSDLRKPGMSGVFRIL